MQVTIDARSLSAIAGLSRKADAAWQRAITEGAAAVDDVVRDALQINGAECNELPSLLNTVDIFGAVWTDERIRQEAQEHDAANTQLRNLGLALRRVQPR